MAQDLTLDVLAIAAHPDDVELSVGGTLIKLAGMGYRTGILDLTRGEAGTRGTPEGRAEEAREAAAVLGLCGARKSRISVMRTFGSMKNRGRSWFASCAGCVHVLF